MMRGVGGGGGGGTTAGLVPTYRDMTGGGATRLNEGCDGQSESLM